MPQRNRYTALVERYWREYFPDQVAEMNDPEAFFIGKSQEIAERVEELSASMSRPAEPTEDYPSRVVHLTDARMRAKETAIAELLPTPEEMPETGGDAPADWVSMLEDHPEHWLAEQLNEIDPEPNNPA